MANVTVCLSGTSEWKCCQFHNRQEWAKGHPTGAVVSFECGGSGRQVTSDEIATVTMGGQPTTMVSLPRMIEFAACPVCNLRVRTVDGRIASH